MKLRPELAPLMLTCLPALARPADRTCMTSRATSRSPRPISSAMDAPPGRCPEGTVARGYLRIERPLYAGKVDGRNEFPFSITRADLLRGQQRFNIYCSPCHSRLGDGNGMVVRRGFRKAADYHTRETYSKLPVGHFFDVITNGFGAMPSYVRESAPTIAGASSPTSVFCN